MTAVSATESSSIVAPVLVITPTSGWACHRVVIESKGECLRLGFSRPASSDWCEIEVKHLSREDDTEARRRYAHCEADFHGALSTADIEAQAQELLEQVATFVDERLSQRPQATLAEALGRSPERRSLVFDVEGVRSLLAPSLREQEEACDGYRLTRIRADNLETAGNGSAPEVVLGFQRPGMQGHALFALALGSGDQQTFSRSTHLGLRSLNDMPDIDRLRAFVAYVVQLQDHEGIELVAPIPSQPQARFDAKQPMAPVPSTAEPSYRPVILSLTSPCHQACNFCSLRDTWHPDDGGSTQLAQVIEELRRGRQSGSDAFTLNGFDPLSFSKIFEVLEAAKELGFAHAEVFSPCVLLAEPSFCRDLVDRLPPSRRIHVPLYGLSAEVHDAVVGKAGTFKKVMAALENLIEMVGAEAVTITSVSTRANLHALPELFRFAIRRGVDLFSTMPYPATNFATDRIVDSSPLQTEVAAVLVEALADTPEWLDRTTFGIAPCVLFPVARRHGISVQRWLSVSKRQPQLNGGPVPKRIACPHVSNCAFAQACPAEFFERYVDRYGLDEFQPVPLYDVLRDAGARERPSEGSSRRL